MTRGSFERRNAARMVTTLAAGQVLSVTPPVPGMVAATPAGRAARARRRCMGRHWVPIAASSTAGRGPDQQQSRRYPCPRPSGKRPPALLSPPCRHHLLVGPAAPSGRAMSAGPPRIEIFQGRPRRVGADDAQQQLVVVGPRHDGSTVLDPQKRLPRTTVGLSFASPRPRRLDIGRTDYRDGSVHGVGERRTQTG